MMRKNLLSLSFLFASFGLALEPSDFTGNRKATAEYLDADSSYQGLVLQIDALSIDQQNDALDSISWGRLGQISSVLSNLIIGGTVSNLVYNHLEVLRVRHANLPATSSPCRCGITIDYDVWAGGFFDQARQKGEKQNPGYKTDQEGALLAFDYYGSSMGVVGAALSYGYTDLKQRNHAGNGSANSAVVGVYGTVYLGDAYIEVAGWGSYNQIKNKRNESIDGALINGSASSSHHAWQADLHLSSGYDFIYGWVVLEPLATVDCFSNWEQGFKEHGSAPVLFEVKERSGREVRVESGLNLYQEFKGCWGSCVLRQSVSYIGKIGCSQITDVRVEHDYSNATFGGWKNYVSPSFELFFNKKKDWFASLAYKGEYFSGYRSNDWMGRIGMFF